MPGNNSPFPWNPSTRKTPLIAGQLNAGEWVQVFVSYRAGSANPVVFLPGRFMIHVLVTPCTDDTVHHFEQPTTFGGSPTAQNRRREYRIDPGVCFQVPWRSELKIVAGGDSDPALFVDVIVARGYPPRVPMDQMMAQLGEFYDEALLATFISQNRTPTIFAPPVVGVPQLVPSTWIAIAHAGAGVIPIEFPDGAQEISLVDDTAVPGSPIDLTLTALGNNLRTWFASGIRQNIGPWTQGGQCSDGTPGTWIPTTNNIARATIYSSFGC